MLGILVKTQTDYGPRKIHKHFLFIHYLYILKVLKKGKMILFNFWVESLFKDVDKMIFANLSEKDTTRVIRWLTRTMRCVISSIEECFRQILMQESEGRETK